MLKDKNIKSNGCNIHIMPPSITDEDINSLFAGFLKLVRKKQELDTRAEILNLNNDNQKLLKQLKQKQAECTRLKNQVMYLQQQLSNPQPLK